MIVNDDQYRLLYAAATNDVPLMKALHLKGWQVNSYDYDGRTALGLAASEGYVDAIKYLLAHGADPKIKDARGNNALEDAIRENRTEAIEVLKPLFE
jgi:glutaminase